MQARKAIFGDDYYSEEFEQSIDQRFPSEERASEQNFYQIQRLRSDERP